ncbi:MAG: class I SAM-dependent methyltransferase [Clostridia bacterium]
MIKIKTCKICGSEVEEFFSEKHSVTYLHCNNCEFIFKAEEDLLDESGELERYLLHENSIEDERYLEFFRKFLDQAVFKQDLIGNKVLDFGSGPEPVLAYLLEKEYDMEVDVYDLFFAPKKVYKGKEYDLITSTEVVEHLKNPLEYFLLFKKHIKEGGHLAIMTLFHDNDKEKFLKWHYLGDMSHISFYTPKTLEVIAEKIGMTLVYVDDYRYSVFKK